MARTGTVRLEYLDVSLIFSARHPFFYASVIVQKNPRNTFIKIMNNYSFFLDNYLSEGIIKIRIDRGL